MAYTLKSGVIIMTGLIAAVWGGLVELPAPIVFVLFVAAVGCGLIVASGGLLVRHLFMLAYNGTRPSRASQDMSLTPDGLLTQLQASVASLEADREGRTKDSQVNRPIAMIPPISIEDNPMLASIYDGQGNPYYYPFRITNHSDINVIVTAVYYRLRDNSGLPLETVSWHDGEPFSSNGRTTIGEQNVSRNGGQSEFHILTTIRGMRVMVDGSIQFKCQDGSFTKNFESQYFNLPERSS